MIMNVLCVYNTLYNRSKQIRSSDAQAHSHSHRIEKWKLIVCMFLFLLYTIWTSRSYSRTINIHTVKVRHTIHLYRSSFIRFFVLFFFLLLLFGHSCTLQNTNTSQFTYTSHLSSSFLFRFRSIRIFFRFRFISFCCCFFSSNEIGVTTVRCFFCVPNEWVYVLVWFCAFISIVLFFPRHTAIFFGYFTLFVLCIHYTGLTIFLFAISH